MRIKACWEAKRSALLRYAAGSLEAGVVYRRAFVERMLLLTAMLLLSFVVLSAVVSVSSSIVAWYSGFCTCVSAVISAITCCLTSSFFASCGVGGVKYGVA